MSISIPTKAEAEQLCPVSNEHGYYTARPNDATTLTPAHLCRGNRYASDGTLLCFSVTPLDLTEPSPIMLRNPCPEGSLIRVYRDENDNVQIASSRTNAMHAYWGGNVSLGQRFLDRVGNTFDWVRSRRQYNFILENDEANRLVVGTKGRVFYLETYDLSTSPPTLVDDVPPLPSNLTLLSDLSPSEMTGYMYHDPACPYVKYKLTSPAWERLVKLRGNHSTPERVYLHARKAYGLNSDELKTVQTVLYPNYDFSRVNKAVESFIDECFTVHLQRVTTKGERPLIDKKYYWILKQANIGWREHRRRVTRQVVSDVVWNSDVVWLSSVLGL